jgi:hypothetical protein
VTQFTVLLPEAGVSMSLITQSCGPLYGVLSKGLLSGNNKPTRPGDVRAFFPRFSPEAEI